MDPKGQLCIIAGMPRSGTTFLYHILQQHPGIFIPVRKEPNYFTVNHDKGRSWYTRLYDKMKPVQVGIDASPSYFLDTRSIEKITAFDPEPKVILGVRKPSELVCSQYQQMLSLGLRPGRFEDFLRSTDIHFGKTAIPVSFSSGMFEENTKKFMEAFGDNLLIFDFNIIRDDPLQLLQRVEFFLGAGRFFTAENFINRTVNASNRRSILWLDRLMRNERMIEQVSNRLPYRLTMWLKNKYYDLSTAKNGPEQANVTGDELALSEAALAVEDDWAVNLFREGRILKGRQLMGLLA